MKQLKNKTNKTNNVPSASPIVEKISKIFKIDKGSSLLLTLVQSAFYYFNMSSDFLSLFLNFYASLNLD